MGPLHLLALSLLALTETGAGPILKSLTPPEGFVAADSVMVYKADRLWDYIDGAADAYLRRGVVETGTVSFRRPKDELPAVTIDLHRFLDPKGAIEMFAEEKSPDGEMLAIGSGGVWQNGMLAFWDSTYYVRIVSETTRDSTILFARALTHLLPAKADVLPIYRVFPLPFRVDDSEGITIKDYLGIPHFDQIYTVRYADKVGEYELFLGPNRPSTWVGNLGDKGTVKASPIDTSPIHLIDLADGRNLIVFYLKGCPYLAGYVGAKPDSARTAAISRWVEALPQK
jgi:hypothetical protein